MRKLLLLSILVMCAALLPGCYEGYTGSDGAMLKQYLEPAKLKELVDKPRKDIWIVDVRPAGAFKEGHIPTAKNFPSGEIMERIGEIPKTQYLIMTCETGGRAQLVIRKLEKAGYTRFMNWGANSRYFKVYGSVSDTK
ncbi:MAG TPA: rhodanese-like domain-containing protein [Spirochaetota bacterium]|nr:rhodanese-like domain-containing protein [Spirochaetota bacterium]